MKLLNCCSAGVQGLCAYRAVVAVLIFIVLALLANSASARTFVDSAGDSITLTTEECTAPVQEAVRQLGDAELPYRHAEVRLGGASTAACYTVYVEAGVVCLIGAEGQHADFPLELFREGI